MECGNVFVFFVFVRIWHQPKPSSFVSCLMFSCCCLIGCDPVKPSACFSPLNKWQWSRGHHKCKRLSFSNVPTCIFTLEKKSFSTLFGWKDTKTGGRMGNGPLKTTLKFSADLDQGVDPEMLIYGYCWADVCVLSLLSV